MATKKTKQPKATVASLNAGMGNTGNVASKVAGTSTTTGTATNSINTVNATNTNKAQPTSNKVTCSLNVNYNVTLQHNTFISAVHKALIKVVPTVQVQCSNNAINFAVTSNTGRPNCRVGGFYTYNGVLQLQCRWLQTAAFTYIKTHGLTVVNAGHKIAKSNNLQLPVTTNKGTINSTSVKHIVAILKLQAQAYQLGVFTASNTLVK